MTQKELLLCMTLLLLLIACGIGEKNENSLSAKEKAFIQELIPLEQDEQILAYECQAAFGNVRKSGNLITDKRLASYWLDGDEKLKWAFYESIDSLKFVDRSKAVTYASYIQVYSQERGNFRIFIDAPQSRQDQFFELAQNYLSIQ